MEMDSGSKNSVRERCIRVAEAVIDVLNKADLNPHEGRLRGSAIPGRYIDIPDFPPLHDEITSDSPAAESE